MVKHPPPKRARNSPGEFIDYVAQGARIVRPARPRLVPSASDESRHKRQGRHGAGEFKEENKENEVPHAWNTKWTYGPLGRPEDDVRNRWVFPLRLFQGEYINLEAFGQQ